MTDTDNNAQTIVDTAIASTRPHDLDPDGWTSKSLLGVMVPSGSEFRVLDLEEHLDSPVRKKGAPTFYDSPSMASYVNRHKSAMTTIFLDDREARVIAVLNGHSDEVAGWGDHRATLVMRRTPNWNRWLAGNEKWVDQETFAESIERNLIDIVDPPGADMLELAQTFQATSKAEFRQGQRLATGERQFTYVEDVEARGGRNGELTIPSEFTLGVAPFEGVDPYKVRARLRFRCREGCLSLSYVLDNPQDVERECFMDAATAVADATGLNALLGLPG
jgi:uncharacterized protein YfdQ (DUF2303 family)